jgi:hypothetical protein
MKTLIITIVVLLFNIFTASSLKYKIIQEDINIDSLQKVNSYYSKVTLEDIRNKRFENKPKYGLYEEDDDSYIIGVKKLEDIKYLIRRENTQIRILEINRKIKQENLNKNKIKYLNFTILQEEDIS